ncbi:MAG: hypothetical protein K2Q03_05715 [Sphingobacteriaceae bacterium]|nr:hypothetical protein [Sphingobacteriaceae bacterium]
MPLETELSADIENAMNSVSDVQGDPKELRKKQSEAIAKAVAKAIKNAFNTVIGAGVPVPQDGGAGLKNTMKASISTLVVLIILSFSACKTCKDTQIEVKIRDTVYIPEAKLNTTFDPNLQTPINLSQGRLRLFITPIDSSIVVHDTVTVVKKFKVSATCLADTIYKDKKIFVPGKVKIEKELPWWVYVCFAVFMLIILGLVFKK